MDNDSEIASLESRAFASLVPSKSKRTYEQAFADYRSFMDSRGDSIQATTDITIMSYLERRFADGISASTLQTKLSAIKNQLMVNRIPVPSMALPLQWIRGKMATHVPKQAKIFQPSELKRFIELSDLSVLHLQFSIVALTMFHMGLRVGEITYLVWNRVQQFDDKIKIFIPSSKTDKAGAGVWQVVPVDPANPTSCLVSLFHRYWLMIPEDLKIPSKRVFIRFENGKFADRPHGEKWFNSVGVEIARALKLPDPECYTSHCFRRSSTTALAEVGASTDQIRRHGRWQSDNVPKRYTESTERGKVETVKLLQQQLGDPSAAIPSDKRRRDRCSEPEGAGDVRGGAGRDGPCVVKRCRNVTVFNLTIYKGANLDKEAASSIIVQDSKVSGEESAD
jgi:integrase